MARCDKCRKQSILIIIIFLAVLIKYSTYQNEQCFSLQFTLGLSYLGLQILHQGIWKDYSAGFIKLAVWSRTEGVFCYSAYNPVIPSINIQHLKSLHCGQFCTTHQQRAIGFSPNLDASLTFYLFLTKWHKASLLHSFIIYVLLLSLSSGSF